MGVLEWAVDDVVGVFVVGGGELAWEGEGGGGAESKLECY